MCALNQQQITNMRDLICLFAICFLTSCAPKVYKLQGTYSNGNFEQVSDKSREQVWSNIIDFFAKNGISIKIIDKSSGLITSDVTAFTWTYEKVKGGLENSNAWVVIEKIVDPESMKTLSPYQITGEWNIRVKDAPGGKTLININLVNPRYSTLAGRIPTSFNPGTLQSTGKFENWIFDTIK
jgi:hypothetical protein